MITESPPTDWRVLQRSVARILTESGYRASMDKRISTARGNVNVDVHATDASQRPAATYICECKYWKRRVPKTVVHALRNVVSDAGANFGLIISSSGFQAGAYEASRQTNVLLLRWDEFQALFEERWFRRFLVPELARQADALIQYTEPINSRVFRKADTLSAVRRRRFAELRHKYQALAFLALVVGSGIGGTPILPLGTNLTSADTSGLAPAILKAHGWREFLKTYSHQARAATAEFDAVFGGRA